MNEGHKIQFPTMAQQYELCRDIPGHEVLLIFVNDDDADKFREWLEAEGWKAFVASVDRSAQ